ncbi:MAG: T9SS type A sorting domain-containing protein [candidate division WOR-3 bacterium]
MGSALTYGHRPGEPYGKLFLLVDSCNRAPYGFFWAYAGFGGTIVWHQLPGPPREIAPCHDASICYFFNPYTNPPEEKVLAVFGGRNELWAFDVPTQTWSKETFIPGEVPIGAGGSLKFGGFAMVPGWPVTKFYLIKGGGSPEFGVYNRVYGGQGSIKSPPPIPVWQLLPPFTTNEPGYTDTCFYEGADLAMWPPVPYLTLSPTHIYAMQGYSWMSNTGRRFSRYEISSMTWEARDNLIRPGAGIGGALVSHDTWGNLTQEPTAERASILHCFHGGYDNVFNCYDVPDNWSPDGEDPPYIVAYGSDLVFGAYWYSQNPSDSLPGIWASFGYNNDRIGFYTEFPTELKGSQPSSSLLTPAKTFIALPNPAQRSASFQILGAPHNIILKIYSENGTLVNQLKLENGKCMWNLKDFEGKKVPAGVYFYRIKINAAETGGKLIVK